jgi:hypothetical protein
MCSTILNSRSTEGLSSGKLPGKNRVHIEDQRYLQWDSFRFDASRQLSSRDDIRSRHEFGQAHDNTVAGNVENVRRYSRFYTVSIPHQELSLWNRLEAIVSGHSNCNVPNPLALREQARLAGILSRLSSPYENERATAGLLASAFVAKHDLMWSDLITLLRPLPSAAAASSGPQPLQDRRSRSGQWQGYCRRRRTLAGQTLNLFT